MITITSNKGKIESSYGGLKEEINNKRWFTFYTKSLVDFYSVCEIDEIITVTLPCCEYKGRLDYISENIFMDNLYQIHFSLIE